MPNQSSLLLPPGFRPGRRAALGLLAAGTAGLAMPAIGRAQIPDRRVKIGVLSDMSGPFADQAGPGSVVAAQMAAEDFRAENNELTVEIIGGDHQNKPDIGASLARRWVDQEGVAAVVDLPNSGVGLAVSEVMREKHRTTLASATATSDLTGRACAPTTVQWVNDTWAQTHGIVNGLLPRGGDSWFFITVDYALGQTLERDATEAVKAGGGRVAGGVRHPLNTADMSSFLLQAQSSGAKVIALANTGADVINAIKQAAEFGVTRRGRQLAALLILLSDIHALGLPTAQGITLCEAFYWDLDDKTRAWSRRFGARMNGRMPTTNHAGVYSSTMAYLRAVAGVRTVEGERVVDKMREQPIDDPLFGEITIRKDGRAVHSMHIFQVKTPEESKGAYDYYKRLDTIPADKAFRPMAEGGCPLVANG
ncbi:ABC transporter substrate-binding protein [Roseomonas sp. BN140053]|uniref:ABC transporter substrate-binding protein n=1 Tax=Roseomonas sp. BN140053 TaxID=3391898 RepID=UPI0039EC88AD